MREHRGVGPVQCFKWSWYHFFFIHYVFILQLKNYEHGTRQSWVSSGSELRTRNTWYAIELSIKWVSGSELRTWNTRYTMELSIKWVIMSSWSNETILIDGVGLMVSILDEFSHVLFILLHYDILSTQNAYSCKAHNRIMLNFRIS